MKKLCNTHTHTHARRRYLSALTMHNVVFVRTIFKHNTPNSKLINFVHVSWPNHHENAIRINLHYTYIHIRVNAAIEEERNNRHSCKWNETKAKHNIIIIEESSLSTKRWQCHQQNDPNKCGQADAATQQRDETRQKTNIIGSLTAWLADWLTSWLADWMVGIARVSNAKVLCYLQFLNNETLNVFCFLQLISFCCRLLSFRPLQELLKTALALKRLWTVVCPPSCLLFSHIYLLLSISALVCLCTPIHIWSYMKHMLQQQASRQTNKRTVRQRSEGEGRKFLHRFAFQFC